MTVYVLGGHQTHFGRNWGREGLGIADLISDAALGALAVTAVPAEDIGAVHVGNFAAELFAHQGQLGGIVASLPGFRGVPTSRHEAACASGSVAVMAALADLEAGFHPTALVLGVEQMRNVSGREAAEHLGVAAWSGREGEGAGHLWPHMFSRLAEEYDRRYGLSYRHLMALARKNIDNAKHNPNAQSARWTFTDESFTASDEHNPVIEGRIRRQDCAPLTDGAAAVILASEDAARAWAARRDLTLDDVPRIAGWGHRTDAMLLEDKLSLAASHAGYMFPHLSEAAAEARAGAGIELGDIDAAEVHDCFTISEYMLTEHLGLAEPGHAWRAIEHGDTEMTGLLPINPSGGLIGGGHPVGATGVRMLLDAAKQVRGAAGDYQVEGARWVQTLNIGGSATTAVSFVVTRDAANPARP